MRLGNRLAVGKQPVGVLSAPIIIGFEGFVGFVINQR